MDSKQEQHEKLDEYLLCMSLVLLQTGGCIVVIWCALIIFEDGNGQNAVYVTGSSVLHGGFMTFNFCVFMMESPLNCLFAETCYTNKIDWLIDWSISDQI